MKTVFADTIYWAALLTGSDPWAKLAVRVTRQLGPVHLVTTEEVLSELLTAMSRAGRTARRIAPERVLDLLHDEDVTVYPQSHETLGNFGASMRIAPSSSFPDTITGCSQLRQERQWSFLSDQRLLRTSRR